MYDLGDLILRALRENTSHYPQREGEMVPREKEDSPEIPPVSDAPPTPLTPPPSYRGCSGDPRLH